MRVYLETFGCRANQYDTESVHAMLVAAGHRVVDSPADADAAVFNSCAVTAEAEADLRQHVRRAARDNPAIRSIVMGCAAALDRGDIRALPSVMTVVPGADLEGVARAFDLDPVLASTRAASQRHARALLRIQDGCDEHCTFCATRLARGAARSRPVDALVAEGQALAAHHAEIVLTGTHIGQYGRDRGGSLGQLVTRLLDAVPRVRFRLSSIEATELDDRLARALAGTPGACGATLAPFLHAPLQSGSDRVLRRMGRHWYTAAEYQRAVERVAAGRGVFALGADIIVGFPGERDDDHRRTLALVEALPFTFLHVFPYSVRPDTPAAQLRERVPGDVISERARELRALAARKALAYRSTRAGQMADVVVVGRRASPDGVTEDALTVTLAGEPIAHGARVRARLELRGDRLFAVPSGV